MCVCVYNCVCVSVCIIVCVCMSLCQKCVSNPRPPTYEAKYEQTSGEHMTQIASKSGTLDSFVAIFLFIVLPSMWGLGSQNDCPLCVCVCVRVPYLLSSSCCISWSSSRSTSEPFIAHLFFHPFGPWPLPHRHVGQEKNQ